MENHFLKYYKRFGKIYLAICRIGDKIHDYLEKCRSRLSCEKCKRKSIFMDVKCPFPKSHLLVCPHCLTITTRYYLADYLL